MSLSFIGRGGHIAGYDVLIINDAVIVSRGTRSTRYAVPNFGTAIGELAARPGFRLGWAKMPDDSHILFFYDRGDENFGYALNLTFTELSEWGYTPFITA